MYGVKFCNIQTLVNAAGNGLDVSDQLVLDALQVETIFCGDQVNSQTQVTIPAWIQRVKTFKNICAKHNNANPATKPLLCFTWSANAMQVRLCIFGKVKVDDYIDSLDVNSSREKICEMEGIGQKSFRKKSFE